MGNYHEKNKNAYDKKAHNYDHTYDGKFTEKFKALLLANLSVRDKDSVLDVGCGNGTLLAKIAGLRQINGFGTDISPQMILQAKGRYPTFHFSVAGCENLPFEDQTIDILTVCAAYHHFPDVDAFALEAKRVLKPGGNLYIAEVYLPPVIRPMANLFLPLSKDGDVKFYSSKEIADTFSNAGFRLVNVLRERHIQIVQVQRT